MRIAIDARKIADFGIGTYIRGLLRGLAAIRGDETYVVFAPKDVEVPAGFEHHVVDAPHYSLQEMFAVGRAIAEVKADLFHAPHYVVPFTKCRTVVTIHDLIHLHQKLRNPLAPLYARMMLRRAVRKAARILTVTAAVKRQLIEELGARDVVVAPNGIDAAFRSVEVPPPRRHTAAEAAAAPPRTYFLYAGNDKRHKNVDALVAARPPDIPLVLAGASFDRFRNRDGVIVAGFVPIEELAALYRGALALVMPSSEEGFGLPAAEAMACGTAVITSNAPALVEITGDAALHVELAELRDAMQRVASDEALRRELGARGIERAKTFSWRRCAEITREAYRAAGGGWPMAEE